jgi:thiamine transport system permease protein
VLLATLAPRLGFTTLQAFLSTVLTLLLGVPSAVLFARYSFPGKRALRSLLTIPFVMPSVVAGIGFLTLVGPRGSLGVNLRDTFAIVLIAHVFYNYAIVVRVVGSYLESVAPRLREAAAMLGSSTWSTFWRITLPLARPAILAAATLVFIFTFTSFGIILIVAPAPEFATLEVEIYRLTARLLRLDAAAVLVLGQLAVITAVTWVYTRSQARLAVELEGPSGRLPTPRRVGAIVLIAVLGLSLAVVLSPLVALVVQSFTRPVAGGPTFQNYLSLLESTRTIGFAGLGPALRNSLLFATAAATLGLVLGFAFAYAVGRGGHGWLDQLSLLPLATSAVTLGFGYLLTYPGLTVSAWGIILAHTLSAFPFVARALLPGIRALSRNTSGATETLGAGPWRTLQRIELPLLAPSLVSAASFAFAVSLGEFGATIVLSQPEHATLPVAIFDRLSRPGASSYGSALALAVILMVLTGVTMMMLERFGEGEF